MEADEDSRPVSHSIYTTEKTVADKSYKSQNMTDRRYLQVGHKTNFASLFTTSLSKVYYLSNRYLCWNEVGIVRCHAQENGESSIDVEFHDANMHHGIHLNNYLNHTMASLSSSVLALACETPRLEFYLRFFVKEVSEPIYSIIEFTITTVYIVI